MYNYSTSTYIILIYTNDHLLAIPLYIHAGSKLSTIGNDKENTSNILLLWPQEFQGPWLQIDFNVSSKKVFFY